MEEPKGLRFWFSDQSPEERGVIAPRSSSVWGVLPQGRRKDNPQRIRWSAQIWRDACGSWTAWKWLLNPPQDFDGRASWPRHEGTVRNTL